MQTAVLWCPASGCSFGVSASAMTEARRQLDEHERAVHVVDAGGMAASAGAASDTVTVAQGGERGSVGVGVGVGKGEGEGGEIVEEEGEVEGVGVNAIADASVDAGAANPVGYVPKMRVKLEAVVGVCSDGSGVFGGEAVDACADEVVCEARNAMRPMTKDRGGKLAKNLECDAGGDEGDGKQRPVSSASGLDAPVSPIRAPTPGNAAGEGWGGAVGIGSRDSLSTEMVAARSYVSVKGGAGEGIGAGKPVGGVLSRDGGGSGGPLVGSAQIRGRNSGIAARLAVGDGPMGNVKPPNCELALSVIKPRHPRTLAGHSIVAGGGMPVDANPASLLHGGSCGGVKSAYIPAVAGEMDHVRYRANDLNKLATAELGPVLSQVEGNVEDNLSDEKDSVLVSADAEVVGKRDSLQSPPASLIGLTSGVSFFRGITLLPGAFCLCPCCGRAKTQLSLNRHFPCAGSLQPLTFELRDAARELERNIMRDPRRRKCRKPRGIHGDDDVVATTFEGIQFLRCGRVKCPATLCSVNPWLSDLKSHCKQHELSAELENAVGRISLARNTASREQSEFANRSDETPEALASAEAPRSLLRESDENCAEGGVAPCEDSGSVDEENEGFRMSAVCGLQATGSLANDLHGEHGNDVVSRGSGGIELLPNGQVRCPECAVVLEQYCLRQHCELSHKLSAQMSRRVAEVTQDGFISYQRWRAGGRNPVRRRRVGESTTRGCTVEVPMRADGHEEVGLQYAEDSRTAEKGAADLGGGRRSDSREWAFSPRTLKLFEICKIKFMSDGKLKCPSPGCDSSLKLQSLYKHTRGHCKSYECASRDTRENIEELVTSSSRDMRNSKLRRGGSVRARNSSSGCEDGTSDGDDFQIEQVDKTSCICPCCRRTISQLSLSRHLDGQCVHGYRKVTEALKIAALQLQNASREQKARPIVRSKEVALVSGDHEQRGVQAGDQMGWGRREDKDMESGDDDDQVLVANENVAADFCLKRRRVAEGSEGPSVRISTLSAENVPRSVVDFERDIAKKSSPSQMGMTTTRNGGTNPVVDGRGGTESEDIDGNATGNLLSTGRCGSSADAPEWRRDKTRPQVTSAELAGGESLQGSVPENGKQRGSDFADVEARVLSGESSSSSSEMIACHPQLLFVEPRILICPVCRRTVMARRFPQLIEDGDHAKCKTEIMLEPGLHSAILQEARKYAGLYFKLRESILLKEQNDPVLALARSRLDRERDRPQTRISEGHVKELAEMSSVGNGVLVSVGSDTAVAPFAPLPVEREVAMSIDRFEEPDGGAIGVHGEVTSFPGASRPRVTARMDVAHHQSSVKLDAKEKRGMDEVPASCVPAVEFGRYCGGTTPLLSPLDAHAHSAAIAGSRNLMTCPAPECRKTVAIEAYGVHLYSASCQRRESLAEPDLIAAERALHQSYSWRFSKKRTS